MNKSIAIKSMLILFIVSVNFGVWVMVEKRMVERKLQSDFPENQQAEFLMDYFLPVFQIEPNQVSLVEKIEQAEETKYFLENSQKFVRGLKLLPLVLGNKYHPTGLSCEIYGVSPAGNKEVKIHLHRCVAGIRLAEMHEDQKHHQVQGQDPPIQDGAGGLLATAKVIGLGVKLEFDDVGQIIRFQFLDEDMTVFLKIERIPDNQVLTTDDVHAAIEKTATSISRENLNELSIESKILSTILNSSFITKYYIQFKELALGLIQQNVLAGLTGPVGIGGDSVQSITKLAQKSIPKEHLIPDELTEGLPKSVASAFGYVRDRLGSVKVEDISELTQSLLKALKTPTDETRAQWVLLGVNQPELVFDHFLEMATNSTDAEIHQELVGILLEVNTGNSKKLLSYLLGGKNDLGFRQHNQQLVERTIQALVAEEDLAEPAADILMKAWLDRERPTEIRAVLQESFEKLEFHGQRVVSHYLKYNLNRKDVTTFEIVDALTVLEKIPFNRENLNLIKPFLLDQNSVIQKSAIKSISVYGTLGAIALKDLMFERGLLSGSAREVLLDGLMQTGSYGARLVSQMTQPEVRMDVISMVSPERLPLNLEQDKRNVMDQWQRDRHLAREAWDRHVKQLRGRFKKAKTTAEKISILFDVSKVSASLFLTDVVLDLEEPREVRERAFLILKYPDYYRSNDEYDENRVWYYLKILDLKDPYFSKEIRTVLMPESRHDVFKEQHEMDVRIEHYANMWRIARGDLIRQLAGDNRGEQNKGVERLAQLGVTWKTLVEEIMLSRTSQVCVFNSRQFVNEAAQSEWGYVFKYLKKMTRSNREDVEASKNFLPLLRTVETCIQRRKFKSRENQMHIPSPNKAIVYIETKLKEQGIL